MPFDLQHLQLALAAAKLGSYREAARSCGVSVASVIGGIAALDRLLKTKLFEPSGAGVLPTLEGMRFLCEAEPLVRRAEQIAELGMAPEDPNEAMGEPAAVAFGREPCTCADNHRDRDEADIASATALDGTPRESATCQPSDYVGLCRAILTARKLMGRAFGTDLFADPSGEMLLDLYIREAEGMTTSITSIWNASNAAYGTARRSLAIMEQRGLIARAPDTQDGRRTLVLLTETARNQMEACLNVILQRQPSDRRDA